MQRQEFRHHTDDQIEEYARKGLALVEMLDPPLPLRASVYEQAVAMYAAKQIVFEQMSAPGLGLALPRQQ